MVVINNTSLYNILAIVILLAALVFIIMTLKTKRITWFSVSQLIMFTAYVVVLFQFVIPKQPIMVQDGIEVSNIKTVTSNKLADLDCTEYIVELDTGRKYYTDKFLYGDKTKLVIDGAILYEHIFGILTYEYGDIVIIKGAK